MMMKDKRTKILWIGLVIPGWLWLVFLAVQDILAIRQVTGSLKVELVLFGVLGLASGAAAWFLMKLAGTRLLRPVDWLQARAGWTGYWIEVVALAVATIIFLVFTGYGKVTFETNLRWVLFLGIAFGVACLQPCRIEAGFHWPAYLGGMAVYGSLLAFGGELKDVTAYPFQLYWSEGNRFWDYSILYGRRLYLYPVDQAISAFIDPGRQSLWGLPFLFGTPTIFQMRLWSVLVFTVPYMVLGWFVFRPRKGKGPWYSWVILGLWSFLFLNQGPIYTPLVLAAILVVGGRKLPFWLNLVLVALAGYYAQMSRYTWMFAPAIWAGVSAFLEGGPRTGEVRATGRRWLRAIALAAAGLLGGVLLPQAGTLLQSLQQAAQGGSPASADGGLASAVSRQPLLWERLLPNPTNPQGILIGLAFAVGPLLGLVLYWFFSRRSGMDAWQKLALTGGLIAFLAVGLVASVKIGGGNNLHNLDMFLIGLLIAAGSAWESGASRWLTGGEQRPLWMVAALALLVLYPIQQVMVSIEPYEAKDPQKVSAALEMVRDRVKAARDCGEVLFIDNRQLLTFGYINGVPLIPEYEKKLMMDQAMSENAAYFEPFYRDIAKQRFALIVSEPLQTGYQGEGYQFGNENDAWVKWISRPVLDRYTPLNTSKLVGVQLLVPKEGTCRGLSK
jgi:hypothetical protein